MAKIVGDKRHSARLKKMVSPAALAEVGKAIYVASDYLRTTAHQSIAHGAIQGKSHVPSAPGEPPNWDTGQLATGIVNYKTGVLTAEVASTAPYSVSLEYGTSKMEERPFMQPAAKKTQPRAEALVGKAVSKMLSQT